MTFSDLFRIPPALRHRKFALLWAGLLISTAGSQMQAWSIYWHLRLLSDQPIVISGIGMARFIPILLFALLGGLVADTFNRRRVLFISQTIMLLVALVLGVLTRLDRISIWSIYVLIAILGIAVSFDSPSRQSLITNIVPKADLASAFSLQSIASNVGAVVGPALSGLVIAGLGINWVYWINALSFLAVIIALVMMGKVEREVAASSPSAVMKVNATRRKLDLSGIPIGIRFILQQPIILSSMILDFFASFFSSANSLMPFVARDILHVGALGYGWLSAAQAIGSVGVGLILAQKPDLKHQGRLLLQGVTLFGVATIIFGLSKSFALTFFALVLTGVGDAVSTILRNTIRQLKTPDELRGRMVSINQIFFAGGPRLGEVESGLVAQLFNPPVAIVTGGIGCLLSIIAVAAKWPQLGRYSREESLPAEPVVN